jgi:hypothetical protein
LTSRKFGDRSAVKFDIVLAALPIFNKQKEDKIMEWKNRQAFLQHGKWFKDTFGYALSNYIDPLMVRINVCSFDVMKFDDFLHEEFKYDEEKDGSMKDFLTKKWGKNAAIIIEELIGATCPTSDLSLKPEGKRNSH